MGDATVIQPAGNFYDKYRTRNPVARWLMSGFLKAFDNATAVTQGSTRAIEIGCGEGELSMRLARAGIAVEACDIAPEAIAEATIRAKAAGLDIPFIECAIEDVAGRFAPAELVICCEVLEHLEDPHAALEVLNRLSTRYVLVSVPREPLWRMLNLVRMRYIAELGNTPGHVKHWSRRRFVQMLATRFDIVSVQSPLPWTMVLCRVRR
ncbi:class I SAM-dependent methyltransferase [Dyella silvatica]|uniref:class I SAM-dependent methyltransferase n=1 Tax=Dyella silvatica TaxID=2992128 RepID=UPI002253F41D|nr:methyltransferase domain-containing protein [Dyella silvatica]